MNEQLSSEELDIPNLKEGSSSFKEIHSSEQKSCFLNKEDTLFLQENTGKNFQDQIQTDQNYTYKNVVENEFNTSIDTFYHDQQCLSIASKLSPIGVPKTLW